MRACPKAHSWPQKPAYKYTTPLTSLLSMSLKAFHFYRSLFYNLNFYPKFPYNEAMSLVSFRIPIYFYFLEISISFLPHKTFPKFCSLTLSVFPCFFHAKYFIKGARKNHNNEEFCHLSVSMHIKFNLHLSNNQRYRSRVNADICCSAGLNSPTFRDPKE